MKTKLFGTSANPARLASKKKKKGARVKTQPKPRRTALDRIVSLLLVIVMLEALYCTAVFSNIPFVEKCRTIWIETAMSTMSHQWLATYLIPPAVVNTVTERTQKSQEEQIGANSDWDDASAEQETPEPEPVEEEPAAPTEDELFFDLFWELNEDSMRAYVEAHPEVIANGWDQICLNEAGLDDQGLDIYTINDDQVLAIDAPNQITVIRVKGNGYRGVLALAKDPSRLSVQVAESLGSRGQTVGTIAEAHNGVLAMTGSSFIDPSGNGNGGILAGYAMCDGVSYGNHMGWSYKRLELHDDDRMYITDAPYDVTPGTTDAVEFTPALIVDGEVIVDENCGWNSVNPRAIIGQSKYGEIMMLGIEGRLTYSIGTGVVECAGILERYECMQAMNLDGGTSAILWYDGEPVIHCSNRSIPQGRYLPNAFVYARAESAE